MSAIVMQGDARDLPFPDESVDLIVTSPPYFGQRDYRDGGESLAGQIGSEETPREYVAALLACTREWMRVLKPSGSIFVNLGDKYSQRSATRPSSHQDGLQPGRPELQKDWKRDRAAGLARMPNQNVIDDAGNWVAEKSLMGLPWRYALGCIDDLGLILRAENLWSKLNGLPESVPDRTRRSHEQLFHFVKQPQYYSAVDEIREPHTMKPQRRPHGHVARQALGVLPAQTHSTSQRDEPGVDGHPLGKLPGSVWEIALQPLSIPDRIAHARCCGGKKRVGCEDGIGHFAAFPMELPRRCILGWSPPGICTACGEGRRPVSSISHEVGWVRQTAGGRHRSGDGHPGERIGQVVNNRRLVSITGHACACTPYIDHPGTGEPTQRRDYDPTPGRHPQGTYGRKQAGEYERVGPWREYLMGGWQAPPTEPAIVLDVFGGTGTTALVADVLGRIGISRDNSADYCRLARWRTTDPGERAKAMQVPKPPPVPEGQGDLFAEAAS